MVGSDEMNLYRSWRMYPLTYRAREMAQVARWIAAGQSGSVIGLAGAGKSNFLGFLCHHPQALAQALAPYLAGEEIPVVPIPVDLNDLPARSLDVFYRLILRSFYEVRERFAPPLQAVVTQLFLENRGVRDPFLAQTALRELFFQLRNRPVRTVLVMDRFDRFGRSAPTRILDTLRGLRDSFKDTLVYLVGMRQEMTYLFAPDALGEMYEVLDTHICWVGPMADEDARRLVAEETRTADPPPDPSEVAALLTLTGGYPALLKAACHWWMSFSPSDSHRPPVGRWQEALLQERATISRLEEMWAGLTQEERQVLIELRRREQPHRASAVMGIRKLEAKGICRPAPGGCGWAIFSPLLAGYIAGADLQGWGRIRFDEATDALYQGTERLEGLSPLERSVLEFLVRHPYVRHTKTDLIVGAWPDELRRQGVSDDSLYQVIRELRKKIEPSPAHPSYIVTWRGRPEGGYRFFPEGRPE